MALDGSDVEELNRSLGPGQVSGDTEPVDGAGGVQVTCFSEVVNEVTLHFQIIRLPKQIYAWVGCNSSKLGHLYAAASTRPNNAVSVASILGGGSDNAGSGIARRLVLKTGINIVLACNIPKNSPTIEADAERILVKKLIDLGFGRGRNVK
ncbi:proteasome assembly chaperone 4 [Punica granatum]|uniref:Proteasome assembly chaperone 4 n=1 Tax=Punica granatum TaxID=22663 RepID=A0A6P8DGN9_PUNGR|nr:proteasome assembly chaperone 4-like [Punica granatum]XP_031396492.1 proteasome assembly chaperone 4 [Punica granatum]